MKRRFDIKATSRISVFAAVMAVGAWIWIPGPVPFTLQALGVFLAATLIGAKKSLIAVMVYLLLGGIGIPVFSGGRSGLGVIFGATGGFLIGFLPMAYICGKMCEKLKRSPKTLIKSMVLGLISCYITGALWYAILYLGKPYGLSLKVALVQCIVPFIIPDILKIIIATLIVNRIVTHTKLFPL